jgi:diguanylate cyclase (GGDEF)-like protein/PAS domain S-box-containing protein
MGSEDPFEQNTPVATIEALLLEHQDAFVVAVDAAGLYIAIPASVPVSGHPTLGGRSFLEHVVADDLAAVARAWYELLATGASEVWVRLTGYPDQRFHVYMADTRESYGAIVGVAVPDRENGDGPAAKRAVVEIGRPRYATVRFDGQAAVLSCDEAYTAMTGWAADDIVGKTSLDRVHPDHQIRSIEGWMAMLATGNPYRTRAQYRCKDGSWIWLDSTLRSYLGQADRDYVLSEIIDVSGEMVAQEALAAREQLLDRLAQALPVGIFQIATDRSIIYSNARLHEILGTAATAGLTELLGSVAAEHRPRLDAAMNAVLSNDAVADIEVDLCLPGSGERRYCLVSSRALNSVDGSVTGAIVCLSDITDSVRMRLELEARAAELEDWAAFDMLTRCYNRGAVMAAIDQALLDEGSATIGVIFVDLDNFKPVNDEFGHAAGDEVLVAVAERLRACMRGVDIVGRIGGDEFLVVCRQIDGPEDALVVARRIGDLIRQEIRLAVTTVALSASIGVACSARGMSADALVAHADEAMYDSKRAGCGLPVLHNTTTLRSVPDRAAPWVSRRPATRRSGMGPSR